MVVKKKTVEKTSKKKTASAVEKEEKKEVKSSEAASPKKKTSDRSVLLKELKAKAKKLASGIEGIETGDIKEELEKKKELLVPLDDYVKTGIHLGTKVITPDMQKYVYRRRADSIGVLNTGLIDDQIKKAIDFMTGFAPEEIVLVCKREAGWQAAKLFQTATGIDAYTKKYPAGMMTNTIIEEFNEPELVIVCDSWIDRNALKDALMTNKKVIMVADTNNYVKKADIIIPGNNKSGKSLGLIFWLLARGYLAKKKISDENLRSMNMFVGDDGQAV
tara:strand:- start:1281 stop:2105 length:825 start_codon:yes stop_codon:yes gene_type:complete